MHVEHKNREWWLVILLHIGIRIRYFFESWFFLKPFILEDFSAYPSHKNFPKIGYWETLCFKLLWIISSLLRTWRPIAILALASGLFNVLTWLHVKLSNHVIKKFEKSNYDFSKYREMQIPTFDWEKEDPEKFYEQYVKKPHPVILKNFMKNSKLLEKMSWNNMLEKYGDETVLITTKEKDGSLDKLRQVENPGIYVHNSEVLFKKYPELIKVLDTKKLEPFVNNMKAGYSQLFIGKYGTGTPFHCAGTWNFFYMIEGTKKWYFVDPNDTCLIYPFYQVGVAASFSFCLHPDEYEEKTFPLHKYCPYYTATIEQGDVLFNPTWWWHSIRNVSEKTVAVATRWHTNGIAGHNLMMTEENYDINRFSSCSFFLGFNSFSFLQGILKEPSPSFDEHLTLREKNNRFYHNQAESAFEPGLVRMGYRFTF